MDYLQNRYTVLSKRAVAKGIFEFIILCPEVAKIAEPGQFVHILVEGHTLRRPISICDIDKEKGTITIVFEVRGKGTEQISNINEKNTIDMIAPLGKGFTILEKNKKVVCIGGGIGTPPMLAVAKQYEKATVISGFKTASSVILQDEFKKYGSEAILCTDDGTAGIKGFVTEALEKVLENDTPDIIYACGPALMLKAIISIADKKNIRTEVSLEERMGCGIGACLVCACKTVKDGKEYMSHVCKDGPVFDSKEVIL